MSKMEAKIGDEDMADRISDDPVTRAVFRMAYREGYKDAIHACAEATEIDREMLMDAALKVTKRYAELAASVSREEATDGNAS